MKFWPFKRNPGRELAEMGHRAYRLRVRAVVDEIRERHGMEPVKWKPL